MANKEKQAVWLYPEVKELLTTPYGGSKCKVAERFY